MYPKVNTKFNEVVATALSNKTALEASIAAANALISGNELDIETKLAAHLASIAAHAAEVITMADAGFTATNVKAALLELLTRVNNIVANSGTANTEVVDARLGADGTTRANLGTMVREIHAKLLAAAVSTAILKRGMNYVLTSEASPLNLTISGRTLVNLLGSDGGCESLTPFSIVQAVTLSTAQVKNGSNSFKLSASGLNTNAYRDYTYPLDLTKQYILGGWVYIESYTAGLVYIGLLDVGTTTTRYIGSATTSTVGSWQFVYVKIPTSNILVGTGFRAQVALGNSPTAVVYFDSIRLYEVSTTDYTAIGSTLTATTSPSIDDKFPYVDSVKHLTNPSVTKYGKNLLPPFSEWTLHANAVVTEPYKLSIVATAANQNSNSPLIPALPNTQYTLSAKNNSLGFQYALRQYDSNGTQLATTALSTQSQLTITTVSNVSHLLLLAVTNGPGTGTWEEPLLELGSTKTTFEPANPDYLFAPVTLASNIDGTVKDSLTFRDGAWYKTKRWMTDVVLDGSLGWLFSGDDVGFKNMYINADVFPAFVGTETTNFTIVKYNGGILKNSSSVTSGDIGWYRTNTTPKRWYVSIPDTDSGWGESYTPSEAEIKAWAYGWKMNNGTFGTAYDGTGTKTWTLWNATSNTGSVTVTPTTLATGYTPYKLSYQLATTQTEVVSTEGSISLQSGGNQVELGEGVIVREKATLRQHTTNFQWYLNLKDGASGSIADGTKLKNRLDRFIAIYKNGVQDKKWTIYSNTSTGYGNYSAFIANSDYDSTAEYTVSYVALDKYSLTSNVVDASGDYNTSSKSIQDQIVRRLADAETGISTNVNAIAQLYKRMKALGG
jgi:hypothetical protein